MPKPRAALATLLGLVLLAACSSAVAQQDGGGGSSPGEVIEGGVLTMVASTDHTPSSFYQGSETSGALNGLVYDRLVEYPPKSLDPQPVLATGWEISDDGLTVAIDLREGVRFHDGKPFTSSDVKYSIQRYGDPAHLGQLVRTAQVITRYDTSDDHRIVLTLEHPIGNLFDLLSIVPILNADHEKAFEEGEQYVGTGPFRFAGWTPGQGMTFEANEEYWDGPPHLDGVELVVIPDAQTQAAQLRSGQTDLLLTPTPRDLESFENEPGLDAVTYTGTHRTTYLGVNVNVPGLDDVRVRRAIAQAIDRDRILEDVYRGQGNSNNLPWTEYSPAYDPAANKTYTGDLDKARALLAEAPDVPPFTITYGAGSPQFEQLALIVQANLADIGLETELEPVEQGALLKHLVDGSFDGLWILVHVFAQYVPSTMTVSAYPFNSEHNASGFVDPGYKRAAERAWKIADPFSDKAVERYEALSQALLDNAFVIGLANYEGRIAKTQRVHGLSWTKFGDIDLHDAYLSE